MLTRAAGPAPPQDLRGLIGWVAFGLFVWLAVTGLPLTEPEAPSAHAVAEAMVVDQAALLAVSVEYLEPSWRDTEGVATITGLPALVEAAAHPGARGEAARVPLGRVSDALAIVDRQSPELAEDLRRAAAVHGLAPSAS